jgi:hypothetical protein
MDQQFYRKHKTILGLVPFANWVVVVHFSTLDYLVVEYKMHAQKKCCMD